MEFISQFISFFLHLDSHLQTLIQTYGIWTYLILFVIIFCETGLVIAPLLPGDSLLFAAGTFAAMGSLNIALIIFLLAIAAILGDAANYGLGYYLGPAVFQKKDSKIFKKEYLDKTQAFYAKYGGRAIIFARFMPIVRTFAPFVAGVGKMQYSRFLLFNVIGAIVWVSVCSLGGFVFGNIPIVKKNFEFAILGVVAFSLVPMAIELIRHRLGQNNAPAMAKEETETP
jgi:membrane-associated protein